ncbi:hypothetical protein MTR_4g093240 [Medicago truncatula]|uniref:Uncharacterized protein n=1 Tax=Medicago truncatula TaxID=3880 RepID=G7JV25_MEDTR|nr:hypothetical protein MTR_4g093240 [Medicago truncatula]
MVGANHLHHLETRSTGGSTGGWSGCWLCFRSIPDVMVVSVFSPARPGLNRPGHRPL